MVASNKSNYICEGGHEGGSLPGRKFQVNWKSKYNWIEYKEHNNDKEDKAVHVAMQMALPTIHMQHLLLMVFRIGRRLWIAFRRMRGQSCTKLLF